MAILDSVIHNFDKHLRSGLCGLISAACESWESGGSSRMQLDLFDYSITERTDNLKTEVCKARDKFAAILASESGTALDDIQSVRITIDFLPNESVTSERRDLLARIPVWYGYDPVYDLETRILLANGAERTVTSSDSSRHHEQ